MKSCIKDVEGHLLFTVYPWYLLLPLMLWKLSESVSIACFLLFAVFFRNPTRRPFLNDDINILSPADGTVLQVFDDKQGHWVIAIFLSILDVHVQYAPTNGKIISQHYTKGRFNPAYMMEKSQYNERLQTDILRPDGDVISVVQIAGQLAQRIDSFVKIGDNVSKGCRLGMIKFSSRVDLIVPQRSYELMLGIKAGDHVSAGITPLFRRI